MPVVVGLLVTAAAFLVFEAAFGDDPAERSGVAAREAVATDGPETGASVFARMGCGSCHAFRAGKSDGGGAPDLDAALPGYTRSSLKAKILDPYGGRPPESFTIMPTDFGRRMTDAELDALVDFLLDGR